VLAKMFKSTSCLAENLGRIRDDWNICFVSRLNVRACRNDAWVDTTILDTDDLASTGLLRWKLDDWKRKKFYVSVDVEINVLALHGIPLLHDDCCEQVPEVGYVGKALKKFEQFLLFVV